MEKDRNIPVKIRRLAVRNYKGIDELEIDFPAPRMSGDPDIVVMGSENGLGKTSIIECCALLLLMPALSGRQFKLRERYSLVDVPDLLIRADAPYARIGGDIVWGDQTISFQLRLDRDGGVELSGESPLRKMHGYKHRDPERETDNVIKAICGFTPNPVVENAFLLFHSYRKVQEGNPELGMMLERGRRQRLLFPRYESPMSAFKLRILRSLMSDANLFELAEEQNPDETIKKLNELVSAYVGGTIGKLRPSPDNTVDFRIMPKNGNGSFTFDGLSSGQKEIISTLFLIWYHTKNNPSVVLIDEPELHLNAEWHRSFVAKLVRLAPQNQYIMATHSEDVMDSVDEARRILLLNNREENA